MRNIMIAAILLLAAFAGFRWYQADQEAKLNRALATNSASVLSIAFTQARALKVYTAKGVLQARNNDVNPIGLSSSQQTKAPFTVDYFVDLGLVGPANYRWDAATKTMFVELPDVSIADPNVDERRAQVQQSGFWLTREAGQRLQKTASIALVNGAAKAAQKPERIEAARRSAAAAIQTLTVAPLAAAGLTGVRVVTRFQFDRKPDKQWDQSRPLVEVLAEAPMRH